MTKISKEKQTKFRTKLKSILFNKNVWTFTLFLLIAAMFWFINTLNKEREFTLVIPIEYVDFPSDIIFKQELPTEVKVKASDLGSTLWKYFNHKVQPIRIRFDEKIYNSQLLSVSNTQLKTYIAEKLPPSTSILYFSPDKINSESELLAAKKVPVILHHNIQLKDQYILCDSIDYQPKEIELYGGQDALDKYDEVHTNLLVISDLADSLSVSVDILPLEDIRFSSKNVEVLVCAEMFTEKTVILPVQIVNYPQNVKVLLFPQEVKTVFNIGVKHFNSFQSHDIQVVFDYNEIEKGDANKMKLKVINHASYISNITIEPEEIDFLLEENSINTDN